MQTSRRFTVTLRMRCLIIHARRSTSTHLLKGKNIRSLFGFMAVAGNEATNRVQRRSHKPSLEKGYVFVAMNYRFVPNVDVKEMTSDIAKSIRWVHDHAKEFGGDPNAIIVMGHSAGAHLAALVCMDDSYLKAEKLSLSIIKGCVPVDCSMYDIPKRIKDGGSTPLALIEAIFTNKSAWQRDCSPVAHIGKEKEIPPFLILHVASRPDTKAQSHWLADQLKIAEVSAKVVAAKGKTHGTINTDLGKPGDKPTQELFEFLDKLR